ncbi:MAG: hypothetical protein Q9195_007296 [Heterodermia aff. obscurata]
MKLPSCLLTFTILNVTLITDAVFVELTYPTPAGVDPATYTRLAEFCSNLQPGYCCRSRQGSTTAPPNYRVAVFEDLGPLDIAAVWQGDPVPRGCSGRVASSRNGPGIWRFPGAAGAGTEGVVVAGASYVRLPQSISAERASRPMLEAQGILAMVTGGEGWVSERASLRLQQQALRTASMLRNMLLVGGSLDAAGPSGFHPRKRSEYKQRVVVRKEQGVAFVQPPPRTQWPDLIIVNGTNYTEQSVGSPVYESRDGGVLRFTE